MTLGSLLLEVFLGLRAVPASFEAVLVMDDKSATSPVRVPASSWSLIDEGRATVSVTFGPYRTVTEYDGIRLRADGSEVITERFADTARIPPNWKQVHELTLRVSDD